MLRRATGPSYILKTMLWGILQDNPEIGSSRLALGGMAGFRLPQQNPAAQRNLLTWSRNCQMENMTGPARIVPNRVLSKKPTAAQTNHGPEVTIHTPDDCH